MAKSKKKTTTEPAEDPTQPKVLAFKLDPIKNAETELEDPRVPFIPGVIPDQVNVWPETTTVRSCIVPLSEAAITSLANEASKLYDEECRLEAAKKAAAAVFKADIATVQGQSAAVFEKIKRGGAPKDIDCRFIYEYKGRDAQGWIPHPDWKTLVRPDTWEIVGIYPITGDDRQTTMNLGIDEKPAFAHPAPDIMEGFLTENGYALTETDDADHPFLVQGPTGFHKIAADSREKALPQAYVWLDLALNPVEEEPPAKPAEYREGYQHQKEGGARSRSPYSAGTTELQNWKDGFDQAEQESELQPQYYEGTQAFDAGTSLEGNPYPVTTAENELWQKGWVDGQSDAAQRESESPDTEQPETAEVGA